MAQEAITRMAQGTGRAKKSFINNVVWYVVGIFDYLNTSAIYIGYITPALMQAFRQTLQYIFFPIYAINTLVYAVLSFNSIFLDRHKQTDKIKSENVLRFFMNLLSAAVVTTAVVGVLAFAPTMGLAATFLFGLNIVATGVYNFICASYHIYQYVMKGRELKKEGLSEERRSELEVKRKSHKEQAMGYMVVAITIAMVAMAGALVMLGGLLPLASIGVVAGIVGAGFCAYALYRKYQDRPPHDDKTTDEAVPLVQPEDSTSSIWKKLFSCGQERSLFAKMKSQSTSMDDIESHSESSFPQSEPVSSLAQLVDERQEKSLSL